MLITILVRINECTGFEQTFKASLLGMPNIQNDLFLIDMHVFHEYPVLLLRI